MYHHWIIHLFILYYDDCVAGAKADAALCNGDLGIESPSEFHYLNQGECFDVKGVDDKAEFDELCRGLSEMGVVDDVQAELWKVLAGVVHLGNVTFCEEEGATGMMAAVDPGAASFVTKASSLLGVNAAALEMGMKRRSVTTRAAAAGRRASMHMIPLTVRTDPGSREGAFNF
jgi:myosin heavy subunit